MKIVLIHDCANYTVTLARALVRLGNECTVIFHPALYLPENLQSGHGLTFKQCDTARLVPILRDLVEAGPCDVLVSNCRPAWIAASIARGYHTVHVAILHGSDIRALTLGEKRFFKDRLLLLALSRADRIFCSTPDMLAYGPLLGRTINELPQPIDTVLFRPEVEHINLTGDPVVLSPTRLDDGKGAERIIRLAYSIAKQNRKARIYQKRWGSPHYLRQMAERIPKEQLAFWNFVPRTTLPSWYASSDLVIGQLEIGSLGCTELEAMSCGVPVVVYDRHLGYGIKGNSAEVLAAYSMRVLEDPILKRKMIDVGRRLVQEKHEPRMIAQRFLREIQSLPESPR